MYIGEVGIEKPSVTNKKKKGAPARSGGSGLLGYERTHARGFHDLIFGILHDARIAPKVSQTAAEIPTMISLVDAGVGIAILPASAVKHSVASVVACRF
jgi:DNA-binding transcriptional LysR family regulator